ncbi:DUF1622 domain-containing protein [Paracoccus sp. KR1-242]|uniref:DUF1622 domain-containing protein n=1 Tax=Paracoccus sp. KR1-242 TaxID=3410028 RepID=UPI003C0FB0C8
MIEAAADVIDVLAFLILVWGIILSVIMSMRTFAEAQGHWMDRLVGPTLIRFRLTLGRWMLTGLEVLIISDILHSIVHRTLSEVGILMVIVVIRVAMAYFLDMELSRIEQQISHRDQDHP